MVIEFLSSIRVGIRCFSLLPNWKVWREEEKININNIFRIFTYLVIKISCFFFRLLVFSNRMSITFFFKKIRAVIEINNIVFKLYFSNLKLNCKFFIFLDGLGH